MSTDSPPQEKPAPDLKALWTRFALFFAVVGVLGSLHLSLAEPQLKACPLCFYQRAFIMSVAAILALGMFLPSVPTAAQTVLALAPALAGAAIAVWHVWLEYAGVLECPLGRSDILTAPQESVLIYILVVAMLVGDLFHQKKYVMQGVGAVLVGVVFSITCIKGVPETPERTTPYGENEKLDGCRKVYHPKT
jgi:Disulfide bond formation protein DsbB